MVSLTPELAGNTLIIMGIIYVVTFIYSMYMAYVGHKQAKVNVQMQEVISLLKEINENIKVKKNDGLTQHK